MKRTFSADANSITERMERIGRNQIKLAEIIIREGWVNEADYTQKQLEDFKNTILISAVSFKYEDNGYTCLLSVSNEKYLDGDLNISILSDNSIEIEGWD